MEERTLVDVPGFEGQEIVIKQLNYGEEASLGEKTRS